MSEKYFNAYVDAAVGMIHEHVSTILQLKSQMKISAEVLLEKDKTINTLSSEIETLRGQSDLMKNQTSEMQKLQANAKHWEDSYHAAMNKLSHMETLTKQYNDLKNTFAITNSDFEKAKARIADLEKINDELEKAKAKINELEKFKNELEIAKVKISELEKSSIKSVKKVINNRNSLIETNIKETTLDDF